MSRHPRYVFVGERRSAKAIRMGVTWRDGRLAAASLHAALRNAGIDPKEQIYVNLFDEATRDWRPLAHVLEALAVVNEPVVALGRYVQRELRRAGIHHIALTHPAALGAGRKRERYHAHVSARLAETAS